MNKKPALTLWLLLSLSLIFSTSAKVDIQLSHATGLYSAYFPIAPKRPTISLISLSSDGEQSNTYSISPALSSDGRFVAFASGANNLTPNDTNNWQDIFVHDRATKQTERISISSTGEEGNNISSAPYISADGRYVVFYSDASNLVPNDTNGMKDTFVHDRQTNQTKRISITSTGEQATGNSYNGIISADNRYIAFASASNNIVPNDNNGQWDVFLYDQQNEQITLISATPDGTPGNGGSANQAISDDSHYIVFSSFADNLVPNDTNGKTDVFRHDLLTGQTRLISVNLSNEQGNDSSSIPSISMDGRYIAYLSNANNLVPDDSNGYFDIFVFDSQTGQTNRVSLNSNGTQSNGNSFEPFLSANGRYVTFQSEASNLVPNDTNGDTDIFVHDIQTGETIRVSINSNGIEGDKDSMDPAVSANGLLITFWAYANNLVPNDVNPSRDIFISDWRNNSP